MKINDILPYFIQKCDNEKEFIKLQKELFKLGYKWLSSGHSSGHSSGQEIYKNNYFIDYPIYISNLSFINDEELIKKFERIRTQHKELNNNNILFLDKNINTFDIKLLRKQKLKKLYEIL